MPGRDAAARTVFDHPSSTFFVLPKRRLLLEEASKYARWLFTRFPISRKVGVLAATTKRRRSFVDFDMPRGKPASQPAAPAYIAALCTEMEVIARKAGHGALADALASVVTEARRVSEKAE